MILDKQAGLVAGLVSEEQLLAPGRFAGSNEPWFRSVTGQGPVLLSAPHACRHLRDGVEKMGEEFTAAIACHLARTTNNHAIVTVNETPEDPNWVNGGDYKEAIRQIVENNDIQLLIDIHGMTNRHHMGVAIGTMLGRSCSGLEVARPFLKEGFVLMDADDLPEALSNRQAGPLGVHAGAGENENWRRLVIDHPRFTGGVRSHTVTRFATEELGISAVQIEIASVARIVHQGKTSDWPHEYTGNQDAILSCANALHALIEENS